MTDANTNVSPGATDLVRYRALLVVWPLLALGVSLSGMLAQLPLFTVPLVILSGPALVFLAHRRSAAFRSWTAALPTGALLAVHLPRAPIGVMFLVLSAAGSLHPVFANVAGPGDIVAGLLAGVGLALLPARTEGRRRALFVINLVGLVDMAAVIVTAQRILLFTDEFAQLLILRAFPFSFIPLLLVPWILISHGLLFVRLRKGEGADGAVAQGHGAPGTPASRSA